MKVTLRYHLLGVCHLYHRNGMRAYQSRLMFLVWLRCVDVLPHLYILLSQRLSIHETTITTQRHHLNTKSHQFGQYSILITNILFLLLFVSFLCVLLGITITLTITYFSMFSVNVTKQVKQKTTICYTLTY